MQNARRSADRGRGVSAFGVLLAFYGPAKHGIWETIGLALMDVLALSWQGAWLGGLIGGGLTTANGAWVIPMALGGILLGGLIGLGVGLRLFGKNIPKVLNGIVGGAVVGGFAASFLWAPVCFTVHGAHFRGRIANLWPTGRLGLADGRSTRP